jgi:hypothetical protein
MANAITVTVSAVDYVFTPDTYTQDAVKFQKDSSTLVNPDTLRLRRVYPKKQKTYPGHARNILTTSTMITYEDGTYYPITWETACSRRADTAALDFSLSRSIHSLLLADAELDGFYANLTL